MVGSIALLVGLVMMGQLRYDTSFWYVGVSILISWAAGVGLTMQNLVLIVQNTVNPTQIGRRMKLGHVLPHDRRQGGHVRHGHGIGPARC